MKLLFDSRGNFQAKSFIQYPDNDYQSLKNKALQCTRCKLREGCTQVVMGEGALDKNIMFIGEGPGADEDRKGRPFVGRAGRLLNKIFSAVNIERKDVYITNIVKCRPPNNRKPTNGEADACSPILKSEIKIIDPKVIIPLGSTPLKYLVDENASITRKRGQWIQRGNLFILPTFHPAYLLRNSNMKKYVWQDFKKIKKAIERINELKKEGKLN